MFRERVEEAFRYAVKSNYEIYNRQIEVRKRFLTAKNVCFWGTGEFFHDCYGHPGFEFQYVCDNDDSKWGKFFRGKECISIEQLKALEDAVVLIMVGNYLPIQEQLNKLGIENYSCDDIFLNVYDKKYDKDWFRMNESKALQVLEMLEDDFSKEVYAEVLCNRIAPHLANKIFNQIKIPGEYFKHDVFKLGNHEVLVDAGAFNGDSALAFIKAAGGFDRIYALEIDGNNYLKMVKNLEEYKEKIEFVNKGVYKCSTVLGTVGETVGVHIEGNSDREVSVISIDELVGNERVTLIKMDIEGGELDALEGAKKVIAGQAPKLAISAYHYLSDLWNIPLKIKSINPDYKIYMRHHAPTVWDTDCYAIVEE